MVSATQPASPHCLGCVYYPPNLAPSAYAVEDYKMLQEKSCCFDHRPGEHACRETRKTSCSLIDMKQAQQNLRT